MFTRLWRDHRAITVALALSALSVLGGWFWAWRALAPIRQPLILHYTSQVGIVQVGSLQDIAGLALLGLAIVVVNGTLALYLDARDWFLGKLLATVTLAVSILLFIAFAAIVGVN